MTKASSLRPIRPLSTAGVTPSLVDGDKPRFEWVKPQTLMVEESYQRALAERSVTLIRRIVANWDWKRMKPPIVAIDDEGRYCVVDGQHTAIAAASHPGIDQIPVMIIATTAVEDRAAAFIGHNRDRVAMTSMQMYYASLAPGDEVAMAMAEACSRAKVTILKSPPPNLLYRVGDTIAVASISAIVTKKGIPGGARVLKVLVDAARAPVRSEEIKAVADLLFDPEYAGKIDEFDLATLIRSKSPDDWSAFAEARVRKGRKMSLYKAVAIVWHQSLPKKRSSAA